MSEPDLQAQYWSWHEAGMSLAYLFPQACKTLLDEILALHRSSTDLHVRDLMVVPIDGDDTFESAWMDSQGRPCCTAKIDDGAPMPWRVEFLDLHLKRRLHELLCKQRNELKTEAVDESSKA